MLLTWKKIPLFSTDCTSRQVCFVSKHGAFIFPVLNDVVGLFISVQLSCTQRLQSLGIGLGSKLHVLLFKALDFVQCHITIVATVCTLTRESVGRSSEYAWGCTRGRF